MSKDLKFLVTGANQGIGLEIVRALAANPRHTVIMTSRDLTKGEEAHASLGRPSNVVVKVLDIASDDSVADFVRSLSSTDSFDALINNAGMAYKGDTFGAEEARITINTNLLGTKRVVDALVDRIPDGGVIVNVCSQAGRLGQVSKSLQDKFSSETTSQDQVLALAENFITAVSEEQVKERGWPRSMYGVSKLAEIAYTKALARDTPRLFVAAMCPGYCSTSMSSYRGSRTAAEGADTAVWLATSSAGLTSGQFWYDRAEIQW